MKKLLFAAILLTGCQSENKYLTEYSPCERYAIRQIDFDSISYITIHRHDENGYYEDTVYKRPVIDTIYFTFLSKMGSVELDSMYSIDGGNNWHFSNCTKLK